MQLYLSANHVHFASVTSFNMTLALIFYYEKQKEMEVRKTNNEHFCSVYKFS